MNDSPQTLSLDQLDAAVELIGRSGRPVVLSMTGESMLPTLHPGQRIAVELRSRPAERGDLLLFRQLDYLVVHRMLGPARLADGSPGLRTRGDGKPGLDPPLDGKRVRGRAVALEARGAWWDLDAPGARLYALAVALHDLFWSAAIHCASRGDDLLEDARLAGPLRGWASRADRWLLQQAHRRLFFPAHRRLKRPLDDPAHPEGVGR